MIPRFAIRFLVSLLAVASVLATFSIVYLLVPRDSQQQIRRFVRRELSMFRKNVRYVRLSIKYVVGRLSEKERIDMKRHEVTVQTGSVRRLLLMVRKIVVSLFKILQSFLYTLRAIMKLGFHSIYSGWRFALTQIAAINVLIVGVLTRIVIILYRIERALTFVFRLALSHIGTLSDLVYADDADVNL